MAAVEALDQIAADIARHDARLREIDLALAEAGRFLQEARQAEARAAARQKAAEAQTLVKELGECFPYLDRHLTEAARALVAIHDGIAKLHAGGFSFPSDNQVRIGLAEVIETWAHQLPRSLHNQLRDGVRFLQPHMRKTAAQYWTQLHAGIDNQITGKIETARVKEDAMLKNITGQRFGRLVVTHRAGTASSSRLRCVNF
jgi:hypothetical protein